MPEAVDDARMWRRSTFCADGACVEVAEDGDRILMRDSKDASQPPLGFDRIAWARFVTDVKSGHFQHL